MVTGECLHVWINIRRAPDVPPQTPDDRQMFAVKHQTGKEYIKAHGIRKYSS